MQIDALIDLFLLRDPVYNESPRWIERRPADVSIVFIDKKKENKSVLFSSIIMQWLLSTPMIKHTW